MNLKNKNILAYILLTTLILVVSCASSAQTPPVIQSSSVTPSFTTNGGDLSFEVDITLDTNGMVIYRLTHTSGMSATQKYFGNNEFSNDIQNFIIPYTGNWLDGDTFSVEIIVQNIQRNVSAWTSLYSEAIAYLIVPPTITSSDITLVYGENGSPLNLQIDTAADADCIYEVTTTYVSTYEDVIGQEPPTTNYAWKTAAVGTNTLYTTEYTTSITDFNVIIGPRAYHTDNLTVSVVAIDVNENRSSSTTLFDAALNVPYGTFSPSSTISEYKIATNWSGSRYPSYNGIASLEDWAKPNLVLCTNSFLYESENTGQGATDGKDWEHWVDAVREETGSNNEIFIGFTQTLIYETSVYYTHQRMRAYCDYVYNILGETSIYVHDTNGGLPLYTGGFEGAQQLNYTSSDARAHYISFFVNEFNHCENRRPYVGSMFDVYEEYSNFSMSGWYSGDYNQNQWFGHIADMDLDGISFVEDDNEQIAFRLGRIAFITELRAALTASGATHFPIGINSVSARADADLTSIVDFMFFEDLHVPHTISTGYEVYEGDSCYDNITYMPYHRFLSTSFTREFCDGIYYSGYVTETLLPNPSDFNASVHNITDVMRQTLGPWVLVEFDGTDANIASITHPVYAEILALMADSVYPSWLQNESSWRRVYNHPSEDGFADISGLGNATENMQYDTHDIYDYWNRTFDNGEVEILIKPVDLFDDQIPENDDPTYPYPANYDTIFVDQFKYKVTVEGNVLRKSADWDSVWEEDSIAPILSYFDIPSYSVVGTNLLLQIVATSDDPESSWELTYGKSFMGPWRTKTLTTQGTSVDEQVDLDFDCFEGTVFTTLVAIDNAGNNSNLLAKTKSVDCIPQ